MFRTTENLIMQHRQGSITLHTVCESLQSIREQHITSIVSLVVRSFRPFSGVTNPNLSFACYGMDSGCLWHDQDPTGTRSWMQCLPATRIFTGVLENEAMQAYRDHSRHTSLTLVLVKSWKWVAHLSTVCYSGWRDVPLGFAPVGGPECGQSKARNDGIEH